MQCKVHLFQSRLRVPCPRPLQLYDSQTARENYHLPHPQQAYRKCQNFPPRVASHSLSAHHNWPNKTKLKDFFRSAKVIWRYLSHGSKTRVCSRCLPHLLQPHQLPGKPLTEFPERSSAYSTQYETHCVLRVCWKNMFKKQGELTMGLRRCFCDSIF